MKQLLIDFINYGIIACVFLIIPYSDTIFLLLVIMLIFDLIHLYIVEKKMYKFLKNILTILL